MALVKHDSGSLLPAEDVGKTELKHEFIELRAKGYSYRKIVKKLDVSIGTLFINDFMLVMTYLSATLIPVIFILFGYLFDINGFNNINLKH